MLKVLKTDLIGRTKMALGNAIGYSLQEAKEMRASKDTAYRLGLDDFLNNAKEATIGNRKWRVHANVNCYIDLTHQCQYDCQFCIAKTNYDRQSKINIPLIKQQLAKVSGINPSLQITGGEPGLFPVEMESLSKFAWVNSYRTRVLNTNGLAIRNNTGLDNFHHINVSAHHYNRIETAELFNTNKLIDYVVPEKIVDKVRMHAKVKDSLEVEDDATDEEIDKYVADYVAEQLDWGWKKEREAD